MKEAIEFGWKLESEKYQIWLKFGNEKRYRIWLKFENLGKWAVENLGKWVIENLGKWATHLDFTSERCVHSTPCAKIMTIPGSKIISGGMCVFSHAAITTACFPGDKNSYLHKYVRQNTVYLFWKKFTGMIQLSLLIMNLLYNGPLIIIDLFVSPDFRKCIARHCYDVAL